MKKTFSVLFVAVMLAAMFCQPAFALTGKNGAFSYEVKKNGDLKITEFNWSTYGKEDVYIPKMIDGYSVTEIGDRAFAGTGSYDVAVIIPDTIVSIGEQAFFETNITTIHIPSSVKSIGVGAFAGCKNIRQFSVDSANARYAQIDGVLYNKIDKELVAYPNRWGDFQIPDGILSIAPYAFYKSEAWTITAPPTLDSIGAHAFQEADIRGFGEKGSIIIHSISSIGEGAFESCGDVKCISLADTKVETIPNDCFKGTWIAPHSHNQGHKMEKGIFLPETLISIGDYAFYAFPAYNQNSPSGDADIISIPSSVQIIGKYAFSGYKCVEQLSFSDNSSLKTISDYAFKDTKLSVLIRKLELPDGLETIGTGAFHESDGYTYELVIPSSVKSIGDNICDRTKVNITAKEGTYAYFWAVENGYTLTLSSDTDWLNGSGDEQQEDTSWLDKP